MGHRVLVIDDENVYGRFLERALTGDGHEVRVCACGRAGVEAIERARFDVVIVDVRLPDMTAADVRTESFGLPPPSRWFAMSGAADRHEVFSLVAAGFHDFFEKAPAEVLRLRAVLSRDVFDAPPDVVNALCATMLGACTVGDAQRALRDAMILAALDRVDGNLTRAADILGVTRQAMQWFKRQMAPKGSDDDNKTLPRQTWSSRRQ